MWLKSQVFTDFFCMLNFIRKNSVGLREWDFNISLEECKVKLRDTDICRLNFQMTQLPHWTKKCSTKHVNGTIVVIYTLSSIRKISTTLKNYQKLRIYFLFCHFKVQDVSMKKWQQNTSQITNIFRIQRENYITQIFFNEFIEI